MHSKAGIGHSRRADAFAAGAEAMSKAMEANAGTPAVVGILYGTVTYDQEALVKGARSVMGDIPMVGCSTQCLARPGMVDEAERVVGAALLRSPQIRAHVARVGSLAKSSEAAGGQLAQSLNEQLAGDKGNDPLLLWYDPLTGCNADALLRGLAGGGFPLVVGGAAVQTWGPMHKTYQYFNDDVMTDSAVALRLSGCKEIIYDMTHGTEPIGLELTITDAQDNVIRTINGEPALDVWTNTLGVAHSANVDDTAGWAIGVTLPESLRSSYEGPITRAVFGFKPDTKELILQAPAGIPWIGMYAWGEIAPVGDVSQFHNYTYPLCIVCE